MKKNIVILLLFLLSFQLSLAQTSIYSTRFDSLLVDDDVYVPDQALVDSLNPRKSLLIPIV